MSELECPVSLELTQAVRPGSEVLLQPRLKRHLNDCPRCQRRYAESRRLLGLASELSNPGPDPARMAAIRARLQAPLPAQERPRSPAWWAAGGAAAALALAAGLGALWINFGGRSHGLEPPPAPAIAARPEAPVDPELSPVTSAMPGPRTLEIKDGHFVLGPELSQNTEPIRLLAGDGEVLAVGAQVELEVVAGRLVRVVALAGRVEIRPSHGPMVPLEPGRTWSPPPAPRRASTPREDQAPKRATQVAEPSPAERQERAFAAGWQALRRDEPSTAAVQFALAQGLDPDAPLAEDAAYWRAVSELRAEQTEAALHSFTVFVARHPGARRVPEAQAQRGWLHLGRGDRDAARAGFTAALTSQDPAVIESARRGLEQLDSPR